MIPVGTENTLIRVERRAYSPNTDPKWGAQPAAAEVVAVEVRAVIGAPRGTGATSGGHREDIDAMLWCDICPLQVGDIVVGSDGRRRIVQWVEVIRTPYTVLGDCLDHVKAGLLTAAGAAG